MAETAGCGQREERSEEELIKASMTEELSSDQRFMEGGKGYSVIPWADQGKK